MEDAAVQAGGATSGNKSRSSQTPSPSTPHPSSHRSRGSWDLSRTQSLPQDQTLALDWAEEASKCTDAPRVSSSKGTSFADALAAFAIEVNW